MKNKIALFLLFFACIHIIAGIPEGYYTAADGKKAAALKTALCGIIYSHTNIGYDGLWEAYTKTDTRADGKVWDMYSCTTNFTHMTDRGNYSKEGDSYNREHSIPQSWFNEASPMKADLFHVYPTDGYVNNRRSNYPFGENEGEKYKSNNGFCKLGVCTTDGYNGTVFEPADEYKGDFARTYFYMVTCYENQCVNWSGGVFTSSKYPGIVDWSLKMFLRWAAEDPVSEKEIARNDAVYGYQHNRNPFIDYPGLEQYVWGACVNESFDCDNYIIPEGGGTIITPDPEKPDTLNPDNGDTPEVPEGASIYTLVTSSTQLSDGLPVLIYCPKYSKFMAAEKEDEDVRSYVDIEASTTITTEVSKEKKPYAVILGQASNGWTLYDPVYKGSDDEDKEYKGGYLALTSSSNKINMLPEGNSDDAHWSISIGSSATATIKNVARPTYTIQYNSSAPRFCAYKSSQTSIQLYIGPATPTDGVSTAIVPHCPINNYYEINPFIIISNGRKILKR